MKPLERIFFIACIREQMRVLKLENREFSVRIIGNIFSRLGFSYKQLMYYVEKWANRGFYEYGVTLDLGWFYFDKLKGEYKEIYENLKHTPVDYWRDEEFSQYIVKETHHRRVTNFYMRNLYGIGEDGEFYGEKITYLRHERSVLMYKNRRLLINSFKKQCNSLIKKFAQRN